MGSTDRVRLDIGIIFEDVGFIFQGKKNLKTLKTTIGIHFETLNLETLMKLAGSV